MEPTEEMKHYAVLVVDKWLGTILSWPPDPRANHLVTLRKLVAERLASVAEQARAEGYEEAREDAAQVADECWHGPQDHGCSHGQEIAQAIRAMKPADDAGQDFPTLRAEEFSKSIEKLVQSGASMSLIYWRAHAARALLASHEEQAREIERLRFQLAFYDEPGQDPNDGWCAEHPRRFQANAREGDEGKFDECQICRAEKAERERDEALEEVKRIAEERFVTEVRQQQAEAALAETREKLRRVVGAGHAVLAMPMPTFYRDSLVKALADATEILRAALASVEKPDD